METKDNTNKINLNLIENQRLPLREYQIGTGYGYRGILTSLIFMNGIIFAHRYGLTNDKRFAALTIFSSLFFGGLLSNKVFGNTKLSELFETDYQALISSNLLKSIK